MRPHFLFQPLSFQLLITSPFHPPGTEEILPSGSLGGEVDANVETRNEASLEGKGQTEARGTCMQASEGGESEERLIESHPVLPRQAHKGGGARNC